MSQRSTTELERLCRLADTWKQTNKNPETNVTTEANPVTVSARSHPVINNDNDFLVPFTAPKKVVIPPVNNASVLLTSNKSLDTKSDVTPVNTGVTSFKPNTQIINGVPEDFCILDILETVNMGSVYMSLTQADKEWLESMCSQIATGLSAQNFPDDFYLALEDRSRRAEFIDEYIYANIGQINDRNFDLISPFANCVNIIILGRIDEIKEREAAWKKFHDQELAKEAIPRAISLVIKRPLISNYDPKEEYYWHDYVREYNQKKIYVDVSQPTDGKIHPEVMEELTRNISRCARAVIGAKNNVSCYFKENDINLFRQENLHPTAPPNKYRFIQIQRFSVDGEDSEIKEMFSIYAPLYFEQRLWVNKVVFEPYHSDIGYKREDVLNTFPGFGAKLVPWTIDLYNLIQPILSHIFVVWANSNVDHYKYILRWMSYPITHLTRTNKIIILKGKQGCGKTFIFEFLRDYVYSTRTATIIKSVQDVLCRFNGVLMGKLLVFIDESASVKDGSMTKKEKNDFKAMITGNTIHLEFKGKDIIELDNRITYAMGTNNENCADLDEGSRREGIFECNPIYCGNNAYFNMLGSKFTQETGDAFYTYLRLISQIHGEDYLPNIEAVPMTEIKSDMIEMNKNKAHTFFDGFFSGDIQAPSRLFYVDNTPVGLTKPIESYPSFSGKQSYYYIRTPDFYVEVYKPWHREFSSGQPWSEKAFSDELYRYDQPHIIRGRKKTKDYTGSITYISDKYHQRICVREPINGVGDGGYIRALVPRIQPPEPIDAIVSRT